MAKRYYGMALAVALCLSVVGCGKSNDGNVQEAIISETSVESNRDTSVAEASDNNIQDSSEANTDSDSSQNESSKDSSSVAKESASTAEASSENNVSKSDMDDSGKEISSDKAAKEATKTQEAQEAADNSGQTAKPAGYGRILFCGDSRTVDMFSESADEIRNEVHDGIPVYCKNGCQFEYMVDAVNEYGLDNFDTLVSWMGCNNFGDFSKYGPYYDQLLAQGKQLVICTVGPTVDECLLIDEDYLYYPNSNQINYNNSLRAWANGKDVKIIDLYSYIDSSIKNSGPISIVPTDGIHYLPQPTTELWNYIISNLK